MLRSNRESSAIPRFCGSLSSDSRDARPEFPGRTLQPQAIDSTSEWVREAMKKTAMGRNDGSVTVWLRDLRTGDEEAARKLWRRYFERMADVARQRLAANTGAFDAEDVASSAFRVFCQAIREGKYDALSRESGLWQLLTVTTKRKAADQLKTRNAIRRGGRGRLPSAENPGYRRIPIELDTLTGEIDDPHFIAMMADECRRLLRLLDDEELETVAIRRMEGFGNEEIAAELGYSRRTIQRILVVIKEIWQGELAKVQHGEM